MGKLFKTIILAGLLGQLTSCATNSQHKLQKLETQIHELQRSFAATNFDIDSLDSKLKSLNLTALSNKDGLDEVIAIKKEGETNRWYKNLQ